MLLVCSYSLHDLIKKSVFHIYLVREGAKVLGAKSGVVNFTNDLLLLIAFFRNEGCNYPLKGGKDTFWEGGVRGVGFVHSNLISMKGRVSYDLIDVTDWLPTFYHLAGGDVTAIQDKIDGMNVWDTIALGTPSPRTEVLNITVSINALCSKYLKFSS